MFRENTLKVINRTILIGTLIPIACPALSADSFAIVPRAETGFIDYDADFDGRTPIPGGGSIQLKNTYQTFHALLRLGVTAAWNQVYLDGYYQATNNDQDTADFPTINYSEKQDGDRTEYALTLGYKVLEPVTVFLGYRHSNAEASGNLGTEYRFKNDSIFLGGSYSWHISDSGVLSIHAAYANVYDAKSNVTFPFGTIDADGDGSGFKLGVSWTGSLSESLSYSLAMDGYRYTYDELTDSSSGTTLNLEETELSYRIGLAYAF